MFPLLNQKLDFSGEQEEHKVVHKFLTEYLGYVREAQTDTSKFDPHKLKDMMNAVHEPLVRRSTVVFLVTDYL